MPMLVSCRALFQTGVYLFSHTCRCARKYPASTTSEGDSHSGDDWHELRNTVADNVFLSPVPLHGWLPAASGAVGSVTTNADVPVPSNHDRVFTWPALSLARGPKHAQKPTFCAKRLRLCQLAHVCESKCTTRRGSPRSTYQTQRRPSPPHTGKASRDTNGSFRELSSFALTAPTHCLKELPLTLTFLLRLPLPYYSPPSLKVGVVTVELTTTEEHVREVECKIALTCSGTGQRILKHA